MISIDQSLNEMSQHICFTITHVPLYQVKNDINSKYILMQKLGIMQKSMARKFNSSKITKLIHHIWRERERERERERINKEVQKEYCIDEK